MVREQLREKMSGRRAQRRIPTRLGQRGRAAMSAGEAGDERALPVHNGARLDIEALGYNLALLIQQPGVDRCAIAVVAKDRHGKALLGIGGKLDTNGPRLPATKLPGRDFHNGIEARPIVLNFARDGEPVRFGDGAVRQSQSMPDEYVENQLGAERKGAKQQDHPSKQRALT